MACALRTASGAEPSDAAELELPPSLKTLLRTGRFEGRVPSGLRVIALSFLADGCAAEGRREARRVPLARACVQRALELALAGRGRRPRPATDDGLWLTHVALVLGASDSLGRCADESLHRAISEALARRSLADPTRHVESYAGDRRRWPADQAATVASLARFDAAHGGELHAGPAAELRRILLNEAMDAELELPRSELTGAAPTSREPRGCALAYQTRFLAEFDEALARRFWGPFLAHYLVRQKTGLVGFREYGLGRIGPADLDSGPIVYGVGAAATALGIPAARVMGDEPLAASLEGTGRVGDVLYGTLPGARGSLPDAIRYLGRQLQGER